MLLSAFVIVEGNVSADLSTQINSRDSRFEALSTHSQIRSFNNNYYTMTQYLKNPERDRVYGVLLLNLERASSFINQSGITVSERQYRIELETPESGSIVLATPSTDDAYNNVKSYIASPKKEPAILTTSIEG
jgi:hypothetical protein